MFRWVPFVGVQGRLGVLASVSQWLTSTCPGPSNCFIPVGGRAVDAADTRAPHPHHTSPTRGATA